MKRVRINEPIDAGKQKLMVHCEHIVGTFFVVALLYGRL